KLPVGPGEEPQMQMRGTVAVPVDVYPGHPVERADRALQPDGHHAELGGEQVRQVAEIEVGAGLEDQRDRQAGRLVHRAYPPAVADPDVRVVLRGARHTSVAVLALPCGL